MKFEYQLTGFGWTGVSIVVGKRKLNYSVSYAVGEWLDQLLYGFIGLYGIYKDYPKAELYSQDPTSFTWSIDEEGNVIEFTFSKTEYINKLHLKIIDLFGADEPICTFDGNIDKLEFLQDITNSCKKILRTYGMKGYKSKWQTTSFPLDYYTMIKNYLDKINNVPTPKKINPAKRKTNKAKNKIDSTSQLQFTLIDNGTAYEVKGIENTASEVVIPKEYNRLPVWSIAEDGFRGYSWLVDICIPDGIAYIGKRAFKDCRSLKYIRIPDSVTYIGERAFRACRNLESISISQNITTIEIGLFKGCKRLQSITLPDRLESIGAQAFSGCEELTDVTLPDTLKILDERAFENCGLCYITIPEGTTIIAKRAFAGCKSLQTISIPSTVTSIERKAFEGWARSLTSIVVHPDNAYYKSEGNCLIDIATNTVLLGCQNSILPDGVVAIGLHAFTECVGLRKIDIPESVMYIEKGAFTGCKNLKNVIIPSSVISIAECAFYSCKALTSIFFPRSVVSMGNSVTKYCYELTIYVEWESKPDEWDSDWTGWEGNEEKVFWGVEASII